MYHLELLSVAAVYMVFLYIHCTCNGRTCVGQCTTCNGRWTWCFVFSVLSRLIGGAICLNPPSHVPSPDNTTNQLRRVVAVIIKFNVKAFEGSSLFFIKQV